MERVLYLSRFSDIKQRHHGTAVLPIQQVPQNQNPLQEHLLWAAETLQRLLWAAEGPQARWYKACTGRTRSPPATLSSETRGDVLPWLAVPEAGPPSSRMGLEDSAG